jgi:hypothetical protein
VFLLKTDTQDYKMSVREGATNLLMNCNVKFLLIKFSYSLLNKAGTSPIDLINYVLIMGTCVLIWASTRSHKKLSGNPFSLWLMPLNSTRTNYWLALKCL